MGRVGLGGSAQKHMHPNTHALSHTHMWIKESEMGARIKDCKTFSISLKQSSELALEWKKFWRGNKICSFACRSDSSDNSLLLP